MQGGSSGGEDDISPRECSFFYFFIIFSSSIEMDAVPNSPWFLKAQAKGHLGRLECSLRE